MMKERSSNGAPVRSELEFRPLTPEGWDDFVGLFGSRGACGGCWCMWWRLTHKEFEAGKGEKNKKRMKRIVDSGRIPGILAYLGGEAVGWCSVAPREDFSRLERSRILKRLDELPVWSIVCLFIAKEHRRRGISVAILEAAVDYAKDRGAEVVEGYAVEPRKKTIPDAFAYHGLASAFRRAGFEEAARRSETRPIMRYYISGRDGR